MPMSTKRKAPKLAAPVLRSSAKPPSKSNIDESRTSVVTAGSFPGSAVETIEISSDGGSGEEDVSDEEDGEEEDAEELNGELHPSDTSEPLPQINGKQVAQLPSPNQSSPPDEEEEEGEDDNAAPTSPSFGELLRGTEAIDVQAQLQQSSATVTAQPSRTAVTTRTHQSVATVLSQALKTDDIELLESCLQTNDLHTIRNTIERIDSTLAATLLDKLSARLHRRPGRAGSLMIWVQWTLVAHGGALASQSKLVNSLNSLQTVLAERSKGLNSLLALKGKLDLLEGQMQLRRSMQRGNAMLRQGDDDEDENVIWVEGEDNEPSEEVLTNGAGARRKGAVDEDDDDEDDNEPVTNGVVGDSDDEDEDSDAVPEDSDEAEESLDEDEVDHDDVDDSMGEDEESDAEAAPPSKLQKRASSFSKRK